MSEMALSGQWRALDALGTPQTTSFSAFQPAVASRLPSPGGLTEIRLYPANGTWPAPPWVLEVRSTGYQQLHLLTTEGRYRTQSLMQPVPSDEISGHDRLGFVIRDNPAPGEPLQLLLDARGQSDFPIRFNAKSLRDYRRHDALGLMLLAVCSGMMLVMAVIALFFALQLHDRTLLHYSGYLLSYLPLIAYQTGLLARPLGLDAPQAAILPLIKLAILMTTVLAFTFFHRFAQIRDYNPGFSRWLHGYLMLLGMLMALSLTALHPRVWPLLNPVLAAGSLLMLVTAISTALKGARYARFFLLGWLPLLCAAIANNLQTHGLLLNLPLIGHTGILLAAIFETLVLSLALAERTALLQRDRDAALHLAQRDPPDRVAQSP
ncbi:MAG: 7TM-DISM domain-containing protein [Pseudomonadota bacterium]|nr:7TM-DISM domain-containing protein [Pseudomonadota bacterium]